jgi:putative transposase
MNRSARQLPLFEGASDYQLFLEVLVEAEERCPIRLLEYCVMPNHWHLLVWPETDDQLSAYMRWITGVHGQRWRLVRGEPGRGAVYQGRFRWVPVQDDAHYEVAREYIRQNPVRARLVGDPGDWPWSSCASGSARRGRRPRLSRGPLSSPLVKHERAVDAVALEQMRESLRRSRGFGNPGWCLELEARKWLATVLKAHSEPVVPSECQNPRKTP